MVQIVRNISIGSLRNLSYRLRNKITMQFHPSQLVLAHSLMHKPLDNLSSHQTKTCLLPNFAPRHPMKGPLRAKYFTISSFILPFYQACANISPLQSLYFVQLKFLGLPKSCNLSHLNVIWCHFYEYFLLKIKYYCFKT